MQKREWALAFVASALFILLTTYPAQASGFHWVDDHLLARYLNGSPDYGENPIEADRFRPLYHLWRAGVTYPLFRDNAALYRLWFIAHNAAWLTLLYAVLRKLRLPPPYAALPFALLLAYPQSTTLFYRFGVQEGAANVLLLAAAYTMLSRRGIWFALALAAGLYKESYALILPALYLWYRIRLSRTHGA